MGVPSAGAITVLLDMWSPAAGRSLPVRIYGSNGAEQHWVRVELLLVRAKIRQRGNNPTALVFLSSCRLGSP